MCNNLNGQQQIEEGNVYTADIDWKNSPIDDGNRHSQFVDVGYSNGSGIIVGNARINALECAFLINNFTRIGSYSNGNGNSTWSISAINEIIPIGLYKKNKPSECWHASKCDIHKGGSRDIIAVVGNDKALNRGVIWLTLSTQPVPTGPVEGVAYGVRLEGASKTMLHGVQLLNRGKYVLLAGSSTSGNDSETFAWATTVPVKSLEENGFVHDFIVSPRTIVRDNIFDRLSAVRNGHFCGERLAGDSIPGFVGAIRANFAPIIYNQYLRKTCNLFGIDTLDSERIAVGQVKTSNSDSYSLIVYGDACDLESAGSEVRSIYSYPVDNEHSQITSAFSGVRLTKNSDGTIAATIVGADLSSGVAPVLWYKRKMT